VERSYIGHIEKGRTKLPGLPIVKLLAQKLGVPIGDLMEAAGFTDEEIVDAEIEDPLTPLSLQFDRPEVSKEARAAVRRYMLWVLADERQRLKQSQAEPPETGGPPPDSVNL
jgi:transcriptional regulator with XRE-family HTH domain